MLKCFLLFFVLYLQGCVTNYAGPVPNLKATGSAATEELKEFTLHERGFWHSGPWLEMGPDRDVYTLPSMSPVVEAISPDGAAYLHKAQNFRNAQLAALGVGIVSLVAGSVNQDPATSNALITASLIADITSIGFGLYVTSVVADIPAPYNRDLKAKLAPLVGMNWRF